MDAANHHGDHEHEHKDDPTLDDLFAEAGKLDPSGDPWPSEEELATLFPRWIPVETVARSPQALVVKVRHQDPQAEPAILMLRRGLSTADWRGEKPDLHGSPVVPILEWGAVGEDAYLIFADLPVAMTLAEAIDAGELSRKVMIGQIAPAIQEAFAAAQALGIELDTRPEAIAYDREAGIRLRPLTEPQPSTSFAEWMEEHIAIGSRIGPFVLKDLLGEGGFAEVYLAEQQEPIKRRVALKILKLGMDSEEVLARFKAERQALARLNHPHIANIYDAGATKEGRPYFVMEAVDGEPLTTHVDKHGLGLHEKLTLFQKVLDAVKHAHEHGIIHRDLKPGNILVGEIGGEAVPKVIDFGIAKATAQPLTDDSLHTRFYHLVGSLAYMSPEQASFKATVDERSDVFSLGCVLYELLTERTPLGRRTSDLAPMEALAAIREELPPPPSKAAPPGKRVSRDLDAVTMKALEKERDRRYDSVAAMSEDIRAVLAGEAVSVRAPGMAYKVRRLVRKRWVKAAALVTVGMVLASLVYFFWPRKSAADFVARSRLADGTIMPVALIQFDGDLNDASGNGMDMRLEGKPDIHFTEAEIDGEAAQVLEFGALEPHQWFSIKNTLGPNGHPIATYTNVYTVVMDLFLPELPGHGEEIGLFQTNGSNRGSPELNVLWDGRLGKSSRFYETRVTGGKWHRVAMVMTGRGIGAIIGHYVDGKSQTHPQSEGGGDGHFAVKERFIFFSHGDGNPVGGVVNSLAIYDVALSEYEVAALGRAHADGIPLRLKPEPTANKELDSRFTPPAHVILPPLPGGHAEGYRLSLDPIHERLLISTAAGPRLYGGAWVYAFSEDANEWELEADLPSPNGFQDNQQFGWRNSIYADWAAVSIPGDFDDERGSISLFQRDAGGDWHYRQRMVASSRIGIKLGEVNVHLSRDLLVTSDYDLNDLRRPLQLHVFRRGDADRWETTDSVRHLLWPDLSSDAAELLTDFDTHEQSMSCAGVLAAHLPRMKERMAANRHWFLRGSMLPSQKRVTLYRYDSQKADWTPAFRISPGKDAPMQTFGRMLAIHGELAVINGVDAERKTGFLNLFQLDDTRGRVTYLTSVRYPWPGKETRDTPTSLCLSDRHLIVSSHHSGGAVKVFELPKILEQEPDIPFAIEPMVPASPTQPADIQISREEPVNAAMGYFGGFILLAGDQFHQIDARTLQVVHRGSMGETNRDWRHWIRDVECGLVLPKMGFYTFKQGKYCRSHPVSDFDASKQTPYGDPGWMGVSKEALDAAFCHPDGHRYFVRGTRYQRCSFSTDGLDQADSSGYLADLLPGAWSEGLDAAATPLGDDRIFLFKGRQFQIYDISEQRVVHEGRLVTAETP